ncbi:UNVERIFIED_CONTAM: hypothetical protein GTU68_046846 [Idotea baltica]|nr:hypothetical protein [Idotea baltica]
MFAPGIKALVEIAAQFGEVVVVAPNSPQSGQGHAITINDPIRLNRVSVFGDIEAYECSGTPVDCVKLAKNVILKDRHVDLCVSGINHGSNASINVIYSGTMSAAMEASLEGIPSIGFSLADYSFKADFKPATPFIKDIISTALKGQLKKGHLINVNIPNVADLKGTRICRQAEGSWIEDFKEGEDPRGQKYYWLTGKFIAEDLAQDTDVWAMKNGYISIVPVKHDLTDHDALRELDGFKMGD